MLTLWLPILLSAVFVFVASSVIHMMLGYHNSDYGKMPREEAVRDALRPFDPQPGFYAIPNLIGVDFKDPSFKESLDRGPNVHLTVMPKGMFNMGKTLTYWFLNCLVIAMFTAYAASLALEPGANSMAVFQLVGVVAFMGYALGSPSESIWFHRPWKMTWKHVFDGLVYALVTAGTFAWLWPSTPSVA